MVGITAPEPKHEKKILLLWISIVVGLLLTGICLVLFLIPRVLG